MLWTCRVAALPMEQVMLHGSWEESFQRYMSAALSFRFFWKNLWFPLVNTETVSSAAQETLAQFTRTLIQMWFQLTVDQSDAENRKYLQTETCYGKPL